MATRSSHPFLSCTDGLAANWADFVQLVGRILLGQLFVLIGWTKLTGYAFYVTYFTALKVPYADIWPWPIGILELVIGVSLLVGFATRYAALASLVFVVIATALAHRYWEYPEAQQFGQYNNFVKNLAVMAGSLIYIPDGRRTFRNRRIPGKKEIEHSCRGAARSRVRFGSLADILQGNRRVHPQQRTLIGGSSMSPMCQTRTPQKCSILHRFP